MVSGQSTDPCQIYNVDYLQLFSLHDLQIQL